MLSANYSELFTDKLLYARASSIEEIGFDFTLSPDFWENWVAQVTGGETTSRGSDCDVICYGWRTFRFEVKFSQAFLMKFDTGTRKVFRWRITKPQLAREIKPCAIVLIGVDNETVWTWASRVERLGNSITVTVPTERRGGRRGSDFDALEVPPDNLLPALLRTWRGSDG
jgi:hypothetical protein